MKSARSESIQERFCNSRTVLKHRQELSQINYKRGILSALLVTDWSRDQTGHQVMVTKTGHQVVVTKTGHQVMVTKTGHQVAVTNTDRGLPKIVRS
jgi:hypothetical protein